MDDFLWSCRSCKASFPTLQNIASTLQDIRDRHEKRIDGLEKRIDRFELSTQQEISKKIDSSVTSMKDDIIQSLKDDINTVVDKRTRELEDRKRRENNITLFNLPEHNFENVVESKKADEDAIKEISSCLGLENLNISAFFRLGAKAEGKTRPVKVILDSKAHRRYLLENAKNIPDRVRDRFTRVIIAKDLTPEQRKDRREKVVAKKKKRLEQEQSQNLEQQMETSPFRRFPLSNPGMLGEDTVQAMPSPIRGTAGHGLHHNNTLSDPNLTNFNTHDQTNIFYDQTTMINMSATGDRTIPGGITGTNLVPTSPIHSGTLDQ